MFGHYNFLVIALSVWFVVGGVGILRVCAKTWNIAGAQRSRSNQLERQLQLMAIAGVIAIVSGISGFVLR
jgi:hypothetical protein